MQNARMRGIRHSVIEEFRNSGIGGFSDLQYRMMDSGKTTNPNSLIPQFPTYATATNQLRLRFGLTIHGASRPLPNAFYADLTTIPERMQRVHTFILFTWPFWTARTLCRLG